MSLLRFGPVDGWQPWLLAVALCWFWSVPVGFGLMLIGWLLPTSEVALTLLLFGWVGVFAPVYSWLGVLLTAPVAWLLARYGWFGWLPAALLGGAAGLIAAKVIGGMEDGFVAGFGLLSLLLLRAALSVR